MTQRHPIQSDEMMFITTNASWREPLFSDPAFARAAIDALYDTQRRFPFFLLGFVIMPDHCHFLLRLPEGGSISKTMYAYKRSTAFTINKGSIWQPRFDLRIAHNSPVILRYIHINPVKAGLCEAPEHYPWSSASGRWDVTDLMV